jgi:hypothetical protein
MNAKLRTVPKSPKANKSGISIRQFARDNNVSHTAVEKAIATGRLPVTANGNLGAAAQRAWDRSRATTGRHSAALADLAGLKLEYEQERVAKLRLEVQTLEGSLLPAAEVDEKLAARLLAFRDGLRRLSVVLPRRLVGQGEEAIRRTLQQEIDAMLDELSRLRFADQEGQQ